MPKKLNEIEKVASKGELDIKELRALLKTMAEDDHLIIHKLEIRKKQNGLWRVIAQASREKNAAI